MSVFCNCTPKKAGCRHQASKIAEEFGIPIQVISKGMDYKRWSGTPRMGMAKELNPCIDCRIYMLKEGEGVNVPGGGILHCDRGGAGPETYVSTPAGHPDDRKGKRPGRTYLEAAVRGSIPPTVPEQEGLVDRQRLLAISGRSRKPGSNWRKHWGSGITPVRQAAAY